MTRHPYAFTACVITDDGSGKGYQMTIGLLSLHRIVNYGSFWQARCLKNMIERVCPCNVELVDIMPGNPDTRPKVKKSFSFSKIKRIPLYIFEIRKGMMFREFQKSWLGCSDKPNYRSDYDAVIIGSDETFSLEGGPWLQGGPWPQLYAGVESGNMSSYAASFGCTTIDAVIESGREKEVATGLRNLRNLSVRDQNSAEIVKRLTGFTPEKHLDPVAVGDFPRELPAIRDKGYILIYSYNMRISEPDVKRQVREFAKANSLKVISVGSYHDWVDKNALPTPPELLSYFRNADYVVTDTFHGTLFSERTHRRFVSIVRESNKQKLGDLLETTGMTRRIYTPGDSLQEILTSEIDYSQFEKFRLEERRRTDDYLKKCLQDLA